MNKQHLLAKFLGASMVSHSDKGESLNPMMLKWSSPDFAPLHNKFLSGHECKFDSDWNWLHVVLNKALYFCHENLWNEWENDFADKFLALDIKVMFKEAVEFVERFNSIPRIEQEKFNKLYKEWVSTTTS